MKVLLEGAGTFKPVTINLTFTSKEEIEALYALVNINHYGGKEEEDKLSKLVDILQILLYEKY